jgi:hypothetical protein
MDNPRHAVPPPVPLRDASSTSSASPSRTMIRDTSASLRGHRPMPASVVDASDTAPTRPAVATGTGRTCERDDRLPDGQIPRIDAL